jgi:hypothetical protein
MKQQLKFIAFILFTGVVINLSCQKEKGLQTSSPGNTPNRPPVANAGLDQTIIIQNNVVTLDGRGSTDPDKNITAYAWAKITGPSSFNIVYPTGVRTQVNNLVEGVYQFELKVTDAGGLFLKDTVQVTISAQSLHQPP